MDYTTYNYDPTPAATGILAGLGAYMFFIFALSVFLIVCLWKIYKKAGKKGWESIIPIYNIIVLLEIVELPTWYIVLYFIPFANIYAMFKMYIELAHKFGQSTGFGVAMVFFGIICLPILAFGKYSYKSGAYQQPVQSVQPQQPVQPVQNVQPQQPVQPVQNIQPQQPMNKKFCPNCGNQVDINDTACFMCGKQF